MLYTSGTTARPKGVPRRQRAERAAALAHVAQNLYGQRERTLGVMPLYHTMGVRSLLAMSLIGGAFVCLPRFDVARALELIAAEKITNLYLVPTLYHDLLHHERFADHRRELGAQARLRRRSDDRRPAARTRRPRSSRTCSSITTARRKSTPSPSTRTPPAKPGSAGRAGINQMVRVVRLGATSPDEVAGPGEEGEIIALLAGDESFEGYWRRPDADAKALRHGWYFTGDTGYFDARRRSVRHRPRRRHDHHRRRERLAGRDRKLPVAAPGGVGGGRGRAGGRALGKDRLRLHQAQRRCRADAARSILPRRRASPISSGRAAMSSSRRIPKSPVGKLLRRKLLAGEYEPEQATATSAQAPQAATPQPGTAR